MNATTKTLSRNNFIPRGDSFDSAWLSYFFNESRDKFTSYFYDRKHRITSDEITYRLLNYWDGKGLINDQRGEGKGWRKFSFLDLIWIHLISELRTFGLPFEVIKSIGDKIWPALETPNPSQDLLMFEFYTACIMQKKQDVYLLIFNDGEFEFCNFAEYLLSVDEYKSISKSHLKISITDIVRKLFPLVQFDEPQGVNSILSPEEVEILMLVRKGEYETITIKSKKGKVQIIEFEGDIDAEVELGKILRSSDYQDISIKVRGGKKVLVSRKQTIKTKSGK